MKNSLRWARRSTLISRAVLLLAVLFTLGLSLLQRTSFSRLAESKTMTPLLFELREKVGLAPALSPAIKIFAVDDATTTKLGRADLSMLEWAKILEIIDRSKPRGIIVDALFSLSETQSAEGQETLKILRQIKTPIYTGVFASSQEIPARPQLKLDENPFDLATYLKGAPEGTEKSLRASIEASDFPKYRFAYGPSEVFRDVFSHLGHLHYGESEGDFQPFLFLADGKVIPHIALRPFSDIHLEKTDLRVDGTRFSMRLGEGVPIDFPSRATFAQNVLSLVNLVGLSNPNARLSQVKNEDFVFLVPLLYSGHTDFKPSPIGLIPGAFAHIAILNSILSGKSLSYQGGGVFLILGFALFLSLIATKLKPARLLFSILALSLLWFVICVLSFLKLGLILPYLLPQLSLLLVGLCLLVQRIYFFDHNAQIIRNALEGVVRPESLLALERNPEKLSLESKERIVTIVFIDIVGFSLMMDTKAPELAFRGLQETVERISACIHKHGGIVNKTLGDGLLCFFGYSMENDSEIPSHAESALAAALEIQALSIERILADHEQKKPLFPLRIGINTSKTFIGNVGAGERIDITLIGSGVNHAKRLEAACRMNCVLIGTGTYDEVLSLKHYGEPQRRFVFIKHHDEQVECWEYEPVLADSTPILRATEISEREALVHSKVQRWNPNKLVEVDVVSAQASGKLVNFWATGFKFEAPELLPRHSRIDIRLESSDGKLQEELKSHGIAGMTVEIVAVGYRNSKYYHEVRYLTPEGKKSLAIADILERLSTTK